MRVRRVMSCLVAVGLSLGVLTTGASASSGPSATENGAAPVVRPLLWFMSTYYSDGRKCDEQRRVKYAQGYPTNPTTGCYRNPSGYWFEWWVS
ncbi:hypothetical protein [Streptomyces sp. SID13726]|uniref:hypothetical protein n=1 Tax=Streptomyces sp. SID13726 TaxID=2706058 RepID=UPI0013B930C3|nr:hypothetical protein [Streptomyces sp. SID13726]NEA97948.1 hypothetical protein [Streptomyces sp. SID13726]